MKWPLHFRVIPWSHSGDLYLTWCTTHPTVIHSSECKQNATNNVSHINPLYSQIELRAVLLNKRHYVVSPADSSECKQIQNWKSDQNLNKSKKTVASIHLLVSFDQLGYVFKKDTFEIKHVIKVLLIVPTDFNTVQHLSDRVKDKALIYCQDNTVEYIRLYRWKLSYPLTHFNLMLNFDPTNTENQIIR